MMMSVDEFQDTGFSKRNISSACRCALKQNNTQEVKNREDDLIDQQFVKLLAKDREDDLIDQQFVKLLERNVT